MNTPKKDSLVSIAPETLDAVSGGWGGWGRAYAMAQMAAYSAWAPPPPAYYYPVGPYRRYWR
jgi:hypothetical protein